MNIIKDKRLFYTSGAVLTPYPTVYSGVTGDTTVVIPAGYVLEYITFLNSTVHDATISCGTTVSGTDLFTNQIVLGSGTNNGLTTFSMHLITSMTTATNVYIHDNAAGDSWNGANVTIYLALRKLI